MAQEATYTPTQAVEAIDEYNGATILHEEAAEQLAGAFDVLLAEQPGELQPIGEMDRLQPDNDDLGIPVGNLVVTILSSHDRDPEEATMVGHGGTQRNYKDDNMDDLRTLAEELEE